MQSKSNLLHNAKKITKRKEKINKYMQQKSMRCTIRVLLIILLITQNKKNKKTEINTNRFVALIKNYY